MEDFSKDAVILTAFENKEALGLLTCDLVRRGVGLVLLIDDSSGSAAGSSAIPGLTILRQTPDRDDAPTLRDALQYLNLHRPDMEYAAVLETAGRLQRREHRRPACSRTRQKTSSCGKPASSRPRRLLPQLAQKPAQLPFAPSGKRRRRSRILEEFPRLFHPADPPISHSGRRGAGLSFKLPFGLHQHRDSPGGSPLSGKGGKNRVPDTGIFEIHHSRITV